jgi:PAS domain S-box-containing protein
MPPSEFGMPQSVDPPPVEQGVFRSLFAAYPDALLLVDQAGSIVMANHAAASLLGYQPGEMGGLPVDALVPDSIRPRHAAYRHAYGQAPRTRPMGTQMELVARRKDGSEVMVEIALSPLQGHRVPLVVAAIRDVAGYPRVKQALQRARYAEHLAQLGRLAVDTREPQEFLDQVPRIAREALEVDAAVVYLLDPGRTEFRIVGGAGDLALDVVGEILGNRPDTLPGLVLAECRAVRSASVKAERRFGVLQRFIDAGIESVVAVPLLDRGRVFGALGVMSTRSARFGDDETRFLESLANLLASSLQRSQTEEALSHSQRLESVGQLTGGIAHDFNNLLMVIQGNLQCLEETAGVRGDLQALQFADAALRATGRAAELTSKLLAFSRRQVLQPATVDVGSMLNSLADMLRRTVDQHIRIDVQMSDAGLMVIADPGQLESALLNIAINARDAMPHGGVLRFEGHPGPASDGESPDGVEPAHAATGAFVRIAVSDTGCGMSEEVRERAFEPFFTTKELGRGTGLGLSAVYGFVKQSKGSIAIRSSPGAGSTIAMLLPRALERQESPTQGDAASMALPSRLHVLLVEDDVEVRTVIRAHLESLGCVVHAAASAEQALEALQAGAKVDVLLTDIALGAGMRGTVLAAAVQQRFGGVRILLMSGYSSELIEADQHSPSRWELLPKPCTRQELGAAIARALSNDTPD